MPSTAANAPIEPGVIYQLPGFMKQAGLGRHALRSARRNGFKVRYAHGRAYVNSDDWFSYLDKLDREQDGSGAGR